MNCSNETILDDLNQKFKNFIFNYKKIIFGGEIQIFFIKNNNEVELKDNWEKISEFIATNFQVNLNDEFSVWNIYLFFILKDNVNNEIKYQIENDTFSSRKIVIVGENNFDKIINEHIINNNLTLINKVTPDEVEFIPNSIIWDVLEGKTLRKIKRTSDAEPCFDKIIEKLKQQENEI
ncbi:MAG: hypothetical protein A2046_01035 [Bacteroidetes bacterium GWA2_30_7]|nr:MAG: hypothetical protein A2046_01035 [Bacteroidetes bacterium GWA2_30_7]